MLIAPRESIQSGGRRLREIAGLLGRHAIDAAICVAVFVAVYRILLPHLNPELMSLRGPVKFWGDEGTVLYHAERIRQGQALYRDFFDFQGLFGFLPFTVAFSLAEPSAETGRITMYLLMAAWGSVTYLTVKEVTQKRWAGVLVALYFPLCVFPTWPYAYQHFIADLWVTCAVLFAIYGERTRFERGWIVAGVFSALGMWTSLSEGAPAFVTLLGSCVLVRYATRGRWRLAGYFLAGWGTVTAWLALHLAGRHSLGAAVDAVLVFPFTSYGANNKTEYAFDAAGYVTAWSARGYGAEVAELLVDMTMKVPKVAVLVSLVAALVLVDRVQYRRHTRRVKRRGIPWPVLSASVYAASLGALAVPVWFGFTRNDVSHIGFIQQTSVIALTVLWAPIAKESLEKWRWRAAWVLQVFAGVVVLGVLVQVGKVHQESIDRSPKKDLDAAVRRENNCAIIEARTSPDDLIVVNYGGWAHLMCRRSSAISFPHLLYGPYWQEMWPQAAREIVERRPRVLFLSANDFRMLASHAPELESMYVGYDGNYMLAATRSGPPFRPAEWAYTIRGPGGDTTRGPLRFHTGPGSPRYYAYLDDATQGAFTYVDGSRVQVFDGYRTFVLELDESGKRMHGLLFEGYRSDSMRVRPVEAEIADDS